MYNRYIPSADGTYTRKVVSSASKPQSKPEPPAPPCAKEPPRPQPIPKSLLPQLDAGDLLVLLILVLVLTEGEDTDPLSLLITLAAFFLIQ